MKNKIIPVIVVTIFLIAIILFISLGGNSKKDDLSQDNKPFNEELGEDSIAIEEAQELIEMQFENSETKYDYEYMAIVKDNNGKKYYTFKQILSSDKSFSQNVFISVSGDTIKTSKQFMLFENYEVVDLDALEN